ncbi:hypothetical protein CSA08_02455 [Candidatus Gracilibacteria bacterium]|nr:MAG: hypothetical protein CSA08_02455 [Candidatus Gracilibacteria bacterium]
MDIKKYLIIYTSMERYKEELYKKELLKLYPNLSSYKAEEIVKQLFDFWKNIIENIEVFR